MSILEEKYIFDQSKYKIQKAENNTVLISNELFQCININETGSKIISLLNGKNTIIEIIDNLASEYGLPMDVIQDSTLQFIENMIDKGILFVKESSIEKMDSKDQDFHLKRIYIDITDACNLNCNYCNKVNKGENELSLSELEHIIVNLKEDIAHGISVFLTGGEPLLHSKFNQIIRILKKQEKIKTFMFSNATLIDADKIIAMKLNLDAIMLSIFSSDKDKNDRIMGSGHYETLLHSITLCKEAEIPTYLTVTPTTENIMELVPLQQLAYDLQLKGLYIQNPIPIKTDGVDISEYFAYSEETYKGIKRELTQVNSFLNSWKNNRLKDENDKFYLIFDEGRCLNNLNYIAKKPHCGLGINEIHIDSSGRIYPCHMLHYDDFKFENIEYYKANKNKYLSVDLTNQECRNCLYWIFCLGGCRAESFYTSGYLDTLNKSCEERKVLITQRLFDK